MRCRPAIAVFVAAVVCLTFAASAAAQTATPRPIHLHWRRVARHAGFVAEGDGELAYNTGTGYTGNIVGGMLLDEQTGRQTPLPAAPAGCRADTLNGFWIGYQCVLTDVVLYSLTAHTYTSVDYTKYACPPYGDGPGFCSVSFVGAGADWVQLASGSGGEPLDPGSGLDLFINIATGAVRQSTLARGNHPSLMPGTSATRMLDLNAPQLIVPICAPIRQPTTAGLEPVGAGEPLSFYGDFAIRALNGRTVLQRCGSRVQTPVPASAAGNTRILILRAHGLERTGMVMRTRRRFSFRLPRQLGKTPDTAFVGSDDIYTEPQAGLSGGPLWVARLPAAMRDAPPAPYAPPG